MPQAQARTSVHIGFDEDDTLWSFTLCPEEKVTDADAIKAGYTAAKGE